MVSTPRWSRSRCVSAVTASGTRLTLLLCRVAVTTTSSSADASAPAANAGACNAETMLAVAAANAIAGRPCARRTRVVLAIFPPFLSTRLRNLVVSLRPKSARERRASRNGLCLWQASETSIARAPRPFTSTALAAVAPRAPAAWIGPARCSGGNARRRALLAMRRSVVLHAAIDHHESAPIRPESARRARRAAERAQCHARRRTAVSQSTGDERHPCAVAACISGRAARARRPQPRAHSARGRAGGARSRLRAPDGRSAESTAALRAGDRALVVSDRRERLRRLSAARPAAPSAARLAPNISVRFFALADRNFEAPLLRGQRCA